MTPEQITDFLAEHWRAYQERDLAAICAFYDENCVLETPLGGTILGRGGIERLTRLTFEAFQDFKIELGELLIFGDRALQIANASGTDTGGFMGMPATGRCFAGPCMFLYTLKNNCIVHERRSYDFSGFVLQLAGESRPLIESAKLHRETLERAQLEHDLEIAAEIQRALSPHQRFANKKFEIAASSMPCRAIGGDFFDYFHLDKGNLAILLGDVSGKGAPAALLAARLQGVFGVEAYASSSPASVIGNVNRALVRRAIESRFATVFYLRLSPRGLLTCSNAGHNPPLLLQRSGIRRLETGGPVLGLFSEACFEEEDIQLEPGDTLVAFSDGITDAENSAGELFGDSGLVSSIESSRSLEPSIILERLFESIRQFTGGAPQSDDMTALVLRYLGT